MSEFNFDEWVNLYKNYPEEFDRKRKDVLENEILKAPIERRNKLRLLQMECDAYHTSMSPIAATVAISQLMNSALSELSQELSSLKILTDELGHDISKLD